MTKSNRAIQIGIARGITSFVAKRILQQILLTWIASGFLLQPASGASSAEFWYTGDKISMIPDAQVILGQVDDIDVACIVVGPANGQPLILEAGIGLSVHYLRQFIWGLNDQQFRVFFCNRPGQGGGSFYSGQNASREWLGFDGALKVFTALRHFAFEESGGQPVVTVGHSLGGIIVRAGSLGVELDSQRQVRITAASKIRAERETGLIVPLFSLPIFGEKLNQDSKVFDLLVLKDILPFLADLVHLVSVNLPFPLSGAADNVTAFYLLLAQNSLHKGLLGTDDLNFEELRALGRFILPLKVSSEMIRLDSVRWQREQSFTTSSGFDFGRAWEKRQRSAKAIPTLAIGGARDTFTSVEAFAREFTELKRSKFLAMDSGHVGAFLSHKGPEMMATLIRLERDKWNKRRKGATNSFDNQQAIDVLVDKNSVCISDLVSPPNPF